MSEMIARLIMVLTGFVLAMLGIIVFIHGEHYTIGILISFAGVMSMFGGYQIMPNKHFCQGPDCHTRITTDRFLKSRGVIRGRYALWSRDTSNEYSARAKYFCSTSCESSWLDVQMENIEQGRPIEFIRHRRESGGYEKITNTNSWGRTYSQIERVDNG